MKYLITSDVHGRTDLLYKAASTHRDREGLIFLGDGIRDIDEQRLTERGKAFLGVRGNCDLFGISSNSYPYSEELLIRISEYTVIMMHGHTVGVKSGIERALRYADERGANVLLFGHTHCRFEKYYPEGSDIGGYTLRRSIWAFNPGSIGAGSYGLMQIKNGQILFSHGELR